jgi:hypothetical protein
MQDSKDNDWANNLNLAADADSKESEIDATASADQAEETDGWQQYRRWISKAPAPRGRRSGVDPSLYTWKGYRNWTEQVKRNWSDS